MKKIDKSLSRINKHACTHTGSLNEIKNNYIKHKNRNSLSIKSNGAITLIALVITIVILIILTGVIIVAINNTNILTRSKQAKNITRYETAKETINLKLMEIQTNCYSQQIEYNLLEIEKEIKVDEKITIEKFYNADISKLKDGVTENIINLSGIVVSVNEYEEYKFLLGKQGKIIGVTTNKITYITDEKEFENLENFEKNTFGKTVETSSQPQTETKKITEIPEGTDTTKPIEITTYMLVKSNTKNILRFENIKNIQYTIEEKTDNVNLEDGIVSVNNNANTSDSCKIKAEGTYNDETYINHIIVYVEPKTTKIKDEQGQEQDAYAVENEQDLDRIRDIVNSKLNNSCNIKLMNDINLNENLYTIGDKNKVTFNNDAKVYTSIGTTENPYSGIFDGNNKIISGFYMNSTKITADGFIGMLGQNGVIKNLTIKNSLINGKYRTGGIAGYNEGKIYRCNVNKTAIISDVEAGGIVAINNGDIIECHTNAYIYSDASGGITSMNGSNDSRHGFKHNVIIGKIYRCYTSGYIGYMECSTIVSHNGTYGGTGYIYDCFSTAELSDNMYPRINSFSPIILRKWWIYL